MRTTYAQKETKWGIRYSKWNSLKRLALFISLSLISFKIAAQELPNQIWHPGVLVLNAGDSIRGKIQYDFKTNLIQLGINEQIKAFSSQQLLSVSFHCQYFKRFRYFYALPYNLNNTVDVPIFFEILEEGPITLMSREFVVSDNSANYNSPFYRGNMRTFNRRTILTYNYYFLTANGDIVRYTEKKKALLDFFGKYRNEVDKYMRKNKLRSDRQLDLIKITSFYNQLATK